MGLSGDVYLQGKNIMERNDDYYNGKRLFFHPNSEIKWIEKNITLYNDSNEIRGIEYDEAFYVFPNYKDFNLNGIKHGSLEYANNIINIDGTNIILKNEEEDIKDANKLLRFHPHSKIKFMENNKVLSNSSEEACDISGNQISSTFSNCDNGFKFQGIECELLGDEPTTYEYGVGGI